MDECRIERKTLFLARQRRHRNRNTTRLDAIYERTRQNIWKNYPKDYQKKHDIATKKNLT
jgi:hypothetical protein